MFGHAVRHCAVYDEKSVRDLPHTPNVEIELLPYRRGDDGVLPATLREIFRAFFNAIEY